MANRELKVLEKEYDMGKFNFKKREEPYDWDTSDWHKHLSICLWHFSKD
jgi:hypothetical protein